MQITEPLILIGTGRCGSTLLQQNLAHHPDVSYLTRLCARFPGRPRLNRLAMEAVSRAPGLQRAPGARDVLRASEAWTFWNRHIPAFTDPFRDVGVDDLYAPHARSVLTALERMTSPRRPRLLLKLVGWPRVGYYDALFERPRFVHIRRDGRAVANSFLNVRWWGGWNGTARWRYGELTPEQEERWWAADRSFVALAALTWELLMDAYEVARKEIAEDRYLDVTYEDLCAHTVDVLRQVAEFGGLPWTDRFRREVEGVQIRDGNSPWRRQLTERQQEIMQRTIEPALARHGYA